MSKIKVQETEITVINNLNGDYISLTDMIKAKDGDFFISDWLRNRNTVEYLGIWEGINNPTFNYGEFAIIKSKVGLNNYKISVKDWQETTNAIGLIAKSGRYGGTYAHKDIAFEFGMWISPEFKIYLIKEFQRLKEDEGKFLNKEWDYRRFLTKVNYRLHTDAIKEYIVDVSEIPKELQGYVYADEAELLNMALFGMTSKQWREENPIESLKGLNIRDLADIVQLTVLLNLEHHDSLLIAADLNAPERFKTLRSNAQKQLTSLYKLNEGNFLNGPHYEKKVSKLNKK